MSFIFLANKLGLFLWKTNKKYHNFQKFLDDSTRCQLNKIWVDKGSRFYNRSMKSWLQERCVQHIKKENLLLLKYLLQPQRIKSINICISYRMIPSTIWPIFSKFLKFSQIKGKIWETRKILAILCEINVR